MYERPVPRRWAEELATLAPKNDLYPWLLLHWVPGDPWSIDGESQIVQRWGIYEMVPLRIWWGLIQQHRSRGKADDEIIELIILEALNGPHPRDLGHYDSVLGRFITEAQCTREEWELYREHKAIPKLFWIIQGNRGGHKRFFTPIEQKYLRLQKLPAEAPAPGSLPYADFDQRTLFQLARRDRLHKASTRLSSNAEDEKAQLIEYRRHFVQYLEDQMREHLENDLLNVEEGVRWSKEKADDPTGMIEEATENFIQTGSTKPPPPEP